MSLNGHYHLEENKKSLYSPMYCTFYWSVSQFLGKVNETEKSLARLTRKKCGRSREADSKRAAMQIKWGMPSFSSNFFTLFHIFI